MALDRLSKPNDGGQIEVDWQPGQPRKGRPAGLRNEFEGKDALCYHFCTSLVIVRGSLHDHISLSLKGQRGFLLNSVVDPGEDTALAPDWDWQELEEEALDLLKRMLRVDTTNPPGNEALIIDEILEPLLRREGLEPVVLRKKEGRSNLVVRLSGDGSEAPLLLHGHVDVVAADPARWSHPPFDAVEAEGCIWGRGAIDMKQTVAMQITTLLALHRARVPLSRDLIVAVFADEEMGSALGSIWLAETHPELLRAEYALGEAGAYSVHFGGKRFYPIMVAEKGFVWLELTARGEPGHGSMPSRDNAVLRLARAADALGRRPLRFEATPPMKAFVGALADGLGGPKGAIVRSLLKPIPFRALGRALFPDARTADAFSAMLHDTAAPTMLGAGIKVNQIPSEASAHIDCRTLPGQTTQGLIDLVRRRVGSDIEIEVVAEGAPVHIDGSDPLLDAMKGAIASLDPGGIAVTNLISGFTDAKPLAALGARTYGFSPLVLPEGISFAAMFHGDDERIPVGGFRKGLRVFLELVREFCGE